MPGLFDTLKRIRSVGKEIVEAPTKTRELQEHYEKLRQEVEGLRSKLDEAEEHKGLLVARGRLLSTLHRILLRKAADERSRDAASLEVTVTELTKQLDLIQALHEETKNKLSAKITELAGAAQEVQQVQEEREQVKVQLDTLHSETEIRLNDLTAAKEDSDHKLDKLESTLTDAKGTLTQLSQQKDDAEAAYKALLGDVKRSIRQLLSKLIEKGYSSENIVELVPELDQIYPHRKIIELEQEIRSHNAEVEALMDLQELRSSSVSEEEAQLLRQPLPARDFFHSIFEP